MNELRHVPIADSNSSRSGQIRYNAASGGLNDSESEDSRNTELMLKQAVEEVHRLVSFQHDMFHSSKCYQDARDFISERPDVMVNSLLSHIQYLFGIHSLEGLLPKMNEVYLFTEEMRNFLTNLRNILSMHHVPEATIITEIYHRMQKDKDNENEYLYGSSSVDGGDDIYGTSSKNMDGKNYYDDENSLDVDLKQYNDTSNAPINMKE